MTIEIVDADTELRTRRAEVEALRRRGRALRSALERIALEGTAGAAETWIAQQAVNADDQAQGK